MVDQEKQGVKYSALAGWDDQAEAISGISDGDVMGVLHGRHRPQAMLHSVTRDFFWFSFPDSFEV